MSMPNFPDLPDLTREGVLNQIVTSVAYEELALSHILNAEGEKIQWVLGTLPDSPSAREVAPSNPTIDDVLDVNESVGHMLDTVLDNQMILSGKLTSALSATTSGGATGATGPDGAQGSATGVAGPKGLDGTTGATGAQGALGDVGPAGSAGAAGNSAADGAPGAQGANGADGATGLTGAFGAVGPDSPKIDRYGSGWATGIKTFSLTRDVSTNALLLDDEISENLSVQSYQFLLESTGYYLISYRIVLEDPVAASTYVAQGDLTNVIEASFVNPGYSETLLVYEKQFIARFEDLDVYFLLAGNPGISATTAPGGIVFNAVKLKDLSIVFEQTTLTLTDAGNAYTQSDLVDVTTIPPGQTITWSSSDENVATVDADGNVTVLSGGNVNISGTLATGEAASYKLNTRETIALASYYQHTLAVKSDGTVWAWGLNENGQLGDGTTTDRLTPVQVQNLSDVISIAAGKDFSLALKQDGTVWAWGLNEYGQLGDGTATDSLTPVQVHDLTDIIEITAGMDFSLARNADGTVRAWGSNYNGQLGDNSTDDRYTPVDVLYLTDVMGIAAGGQHSLALQSDGTVWAWGLNQYGELGDNTVVDRHTPVQVDNLDNVIAIKSAFEESSVALKSDGTVWDWGNNNVGQLGDNTTTERHTPVQVQNMSNVITIAAGPQFCWAVKSDGTAWVWGSNYYGEFGDDSTIGSHVAVQKQNMGADVAFATGTIYSLALKPDGTAWTWGLNLHGALGDNTTTERHVPVRVHGPNNVGWF